MERTQHISKDIQQLETFQRRHLCKIFGFRWQDKISYEVIIEEALRVGVTIVPIECRIQILRLKYIGHVERMGGGRWPRIIIHADVIKEEETSRHGEVKQPRGRRMNLRQRLRQDMKDAGIDEHTWVAQANCRQTWRKVVGVEGLNHAVQNWYVKRYKQREKRRGKVDIMRREKRRQNNIGSNMGSTEGEFESDSEGEEEQVEKERQDVLEEMRPRSTVQRARQNLVENQERIRAIISGTNKDEEREVEDYTHMKEAIKDGHVTVRRTRNRTKVVQHEPRFSARRVLEERKIAMTDMTNEVLTKQVVEKRRVIHARRNTNRGASPEDRWFETIEDAGDIIGKIWGAANLTVPIGRALLLARCPTVANYKYQWEWVLPTEVVIETRQTVINEAQQQEEDQDH